jgi:murein L,D-transpeptidase YcbB/YkuD
MVNSSIYFSLLAVVLFTACSSPAPDPATNTNAVQELNAVFESEQAYTVRKLHMDDLARFLDQHPEFKADSAEIVAFYQRRDQQYAWFVNDSLSQSASGFLTLFSSADTAFREVAYLRDRLSDLISGSQQMIGSEAKCDSCRLQLELNLTAQFFHYAAKKYSGLASMDPRDLDWFIPRRKKDYSRLLDSLVAGSIDLSALEPLHPQYARLKAHLERYHQLAQDTAWSALSLGELRKLEPGNTHAIIPELRRRLQLLGDLDSVSSVAPQADRYDTTLVTAVKRFQIRHGLHPDAVIGQGFLKAINTTPQQRLRTLLVNMERLRWVPDVVAPDLLLVNIPEFRLHVFEGGEEVLSMDVVVGATATRTVIFSDTLSTIVFSPTWTVPTSIVQNEILPAMAKDPNYLGKKGMEKIGGSARNPIIRQKPGANNALGRVKFLFPNSYSIYLHDTPSKSFFAREQRAFSHGCIRVSKPKELAEYLLRNDSTWTTAKIHKAMFDGKETFVKLKEKRPVTIGYFTAWVEQDGRLNFRDDVYGLDLRLGNELFTPEVNEPVISAVAATGQ